MLTGELYRASDPSSFTNVSGVDRCSKRSTPSRMRISVWPSWSNFWQDRQRRVHQPPFACDYGYNLSIGDNVFVNFNTVILDCASVTIGEGTQMGPASRSSRPTIRETREARRAFWSSLGPSRSDRTCGSARRPSCSRESRWGTTPSSGPAAWSRATSRAGWSRWVPNAASCGRSEGSSGSRPRWPTPPQRRSITPEDRMAHKVEEGSAAPGISPRRRRRPLENRLCHAISAAPPRFGS